MTGFPWRKTEDFCGCLSRKEGVGSSGIMNIYGGSSLYGEDIYVAEKDEQKAMEVLVGMSLMQDR